MMGMGANPKKIASIIVSRMSPDHEDMGMRERNAQSYKDMVSETSQREKEELLIASKDVMQAFEERDVEKLASAIKHAFKVCEEYDDEGESEGEGMNLG